MRRQLLVGLVTIVAVLAASGVFYWSETRQALAVLPDAFAVYAPLVSR